MSRRIALACFMVAMIATATDAAVIDQSYVPESTPLVSSDIGDIGNGNKAEEAQTFRVGITGRLTGADLDLQGYGASLLLEIHRTTADGLPSDAPSDLLGAAIVNPGSSSDLRFVSFNFGDQGPLVTAGESLALVAKIPGSGQYDWAGAYTNPYADGTAASRSVSTDNQWTPTIVPGGPVDFAFRTYVEPVPEPSTLVVFVAGGLAAFGWKRRHRQCAVLSGPRRGNWGASGVADVCRSAGSTDPTEIQFETKR